MDKRGKSVFLKSFLFVIVVIILDLVVFLKDMIISRGLSGFSIKETFSEIYLSLSTYSKIFLTIQWLCLLIILGFGVVKDLKPKPTISIKINKSENKTDLDILYDILREKKQLSLSVISKSFNISKEIAMEWCKILEAANLVSIDYPSFSEPVVNVNNNFEIERKHMIEETDKIKKEISKSKNQ